MANAPEEELKNDKAESGDAEGSEQPEATEEAKPEAKKPARKPRAKTSRAKKAPAKSATKSAASSKSSAKTTAKSASSNGANGSTPRLLDSYRTEVHPVLMREFGYDNTMRAPQLTKVVVNIGLGEALTSSNALSAALGVTIAGLEFDQEVFARPGHIGIRHRADRPHEHFRRLR